MLERYDGGDMDWIDLAEDRDQWRVLVNTVMNLRVPQNAGKFLSSCTTGGFSRRAQLHELKHTKNQVLRLVIFFVFPCASCPLGPNTLLGTLC
jgi:hypothetical protein